MRALVCVYLCSSPDFLNVLKNAVSSLNNFKCRYFSLNCPADKFSFFKLKSRRNKLIFFSYPISGILLFILFWLLPSSKYLFYRENENLCHNAHYHFSTSSSFILDLASFLLLGVLWRNCCRFCWGKWGLNCI